jgi:ribosomal protein S1
MGGVETEAALAADKVPAEGSIIRGFVANTSGKGCFIRISRDLTGHVLMKNISDEYVAEAASVFPPGKLVHARVLSVHEGDAHAKLTMKPSDLVRDPLGAEQELGRLRVNDVVSGVVHRVTSIGVFVQLAGTNSLVGLARKQNALSDPSSSKPLSEEYAVGDIVRAKASPSSSSSSCSSSSSSSSPCSFSSSSSSSSPCSSFFFSSFFLVVFFFSFFFFV